MNRVAVVAGASWRIERATAIHVARDVDGVAIAARDAAALSETADAMRAARAEPLIIVRDLREMNAGTEHRAGDDPPS